MHIVKCMSSNMTYRPTECNGSPIGKMSRKRRIALMKKNTSIKAQIFKPKHLNNPGHIIETKEYVI